ncbi:MAG: hypothetical protein ABW022_09565 [Actinoplanes sp.]
MADVEDMVARLGPGDAPARLDRIDGPDSSGTAYAVVDSVGRFVDIGLDPGWWTALGPGRVATGLLEALECARMKAALVPLILRRHGVQPPAALPPAEQVASLPPPEDADFLDAARARIADAYRLIDDSDKRMREHLATRVIAGPRGLFRLHVRGSHIEGADVDQARLSRDDTDRLVADARDALTELTRGRVAAVDSWGER